MKTPFPFYLKLSCVLVSIVVLGFLAKLGERIIVPMILGLLFSILLTPACRFLETKIRLPRSFASIVVCILAMLAISGVVYVMALQIGKLSQDWPAFQKQIMDLFDQLQSWFYKTFGVKQSEQLTYINDTARKSISTGTAILEKIVSSVSYVLMISAFTFLFTLFFLIYRSRLVLFLVMSFSDDSHKNLVYEVVENIQFMVKKYLVGLFLQMLLVMILSFIAFTIIGIKYNVMLAVLTGVLNILPYIGIFTVLLIGVLITFATSGLSSVLFLVISIIIIHAIDANIIMPKVVGSKVKINSLVVIIGLVIGEMLWGISGMLLTIPILAIAKIVFDRIDHTKAWGYLMGEEDE